MFQLATAPRGIGQVLDSVFQLTRLIFVPMLPLSLIGGLISAIPLGYLLMSGMIGDPAAKAQSLISVGYWISILVMLPLSMILYAACILQGESIAQDHRYGVGKCIGFVVPRVITLIAAFILYSIAIVLGLVLLVVPGLILMLSLYMFLPAIVLDGKGIIESLQYSHSLVWGNWWRTAAVATIAIIIIYVLVILVGLVFGLVLIVTGFDPVIAFLIEAAVTVLAGLLITPLFIALYLEMYRDLKMRKTGGDLAARIESAGAPG
ncbi:MAG: hypothetical protein WD929_07325 [Steroidobacteraceae bacterium]